MADVVSSRQLIICTPPPASDAWLERQNLRSNCDDLFISELWTLLDTSN